MSGIRNRWRSLDPRIEQKFGFDPRHRPSWIAELSRTSIPVGKNAAVLHFSWCQNAPMRDGRHLRSSFDLGDGCSSFWRGRAAGALGKPARVLPGGRQRSYRDPVLRRCDHASCAAWSIRFFRTQRGRRGQWRSRTVFDIGSTPASRQRARAYERQRGLKRLPVTPSRLSATRGVPSVAHTCQRRDLMGLTFLPQALAGAKPGVSTVIGPARERRHGRLELDRSWWPARCGPLGGCRRSRAVPSSKPSRQDGSEQVKGVDFGCRWTAETSDSSSEAN